MSPSSESSGSSSSSFSSSSTSNKSSSNMSIEDMLMQIHCTHPLPPPPPPPPSVVTTLSLSFSGVPLKDICTTMQPHLHNQQVCANNNNELLPRFDSLSSLLRRKRICENISKRMMKNRESAARSRARKQAYTHELQQKVKELMEENDRLRRQNQQQMIENRSKVDPNEQKRKNKLRRSGSI